MKEFWKQEYSSYEAPQIEVMQITGTDVIRTSPGADESVPEGAGGAGNWWE